MAFQYSLLGLGRPLVPTVTAIYFPPLRLIVTFFGTNVT